MALIHADFVEETTNTTGTGTLTLAGATAGNRTFSAVIGDGNTCVYGIESASGQFESGIGTVGAGTLERTTLIASSTGSKLALGTGPHTVYVTASGDGMTKAYSAIQPDGTQPFTAIQTFTAGLAGGSNIIADAEDVQTIPLDGRVHVLTLTEPCAITLTPVGSEYSFALIVLIENGTGSYDVLWTNSPKPMDTQALNTAANKHSAFVLWTPNGGTTYYRNGAGSET